MRFRTKEISNNFLEEKRIFNCLFIQKMQLTVFFYQEQTQELLNVQHSLLRFKKSGFDRTFFSKKTEKYSFLASAKFSRTAPKTVVLARSRLKRKKHFI